MIIKQIFYVATLALGSRPKHGLVKVWANKEAQESHFMFLGVQESVREWTFTFPRKLPLWELEFQWTPKFSESNCGGQTHWIEEFLISLEISWNMNVWNGLTWPIWTLSTQVITKKRVRSQIGNLTRNPSFGHNLCFRYSNGSCKPILNIYVLIAFQWYKELFNPMSLNPWNSFLKIWKSIGTLISKVGIHLGMWGFIPSHSPTLPGAWNVALELPS